MCQNWKPDFMMGRLKILARFEIPGQQYFKPGPNSAQAWIPLHVINNSMFIVRICCRSRAEIAACLAGLKFSAGWNSPCHQALSCDFLIFRHEIFIFSLHQCFTPSSAISLLFALNGTISANEEETLKKHSTKHISGLFKATNPIIYMKQILDSDCLRGVQFRGNYWGKSVSVLT